MRSPRRARLALLVLALVAAAAGPLAAAPRRAAPEPPVVRDSLVVWFARDSARALRAYDGGRRDSAALILRRLERQSRRLGDSAFVCRSLLLDAYVVLEELPRPGILEKIVAGGRMAEARGDSATVMRALSYESGARATLGQPELSRAVSVRHLAYAIALGDSANQGHAHYALANDAWRRGALAQARGHLDSCIALFEARRMRGALARSLNLRGNVDNADGRPAEARDAYARVIPIAQRLKDRSLEGYAWFNLGSMETYLGDPARAAKHWEKARALHDARGALADEAEVLGEMSTLQIHLGDPERARELADEAVRLAERANAGRLLPAVRAQLGDALLAAGRRSAAKAIWRGVAFAGDSLEPFARALAARALAGALLADDSLEAAHAVSARAAQEIAPSAGASARDVLLTQHARVLDRMGRPAEALAVARPVAEGMRERGDLRNALEPWILVVRSERRLGRKADAARDLARAVDVWEQGRRRVADPGQRERSTAAARELVAEVALDALAGPPGADAGRRAWTAFDRIQRFKARTLLERVAGPRGVRAASAWLDLPWRGAESFRREGLAPGELLLDYACAADTGFVFAVTRDTCVVRGLPGLSSFQPSLELAKEFVARAPAPGDAAPAAALDRLARTLLPGLAPAIARAHTVVVSPDGPLHGVPFAALPPPGSREPLAVAHELVITPCAALLPLVRSRPRPAAAHRVLAVEGGDKPGSPGLAGAKREVVDLAERYRGVETWTPAVRGRSLVLAGWDGLHFAGHTLADDDSPWRSGFLLGADSEEGDSLLTAAEIAGSRLDPALVVLSSCESAGRGGTGEGVAGLASAFLVAGAPSVVATLWPVDDVTTAKLMARFYDALAHGRTAAAALREAAVEIRRRPATSHPFYWAGFTLNGRGDTHLALQRAPESPLAGLKRWWNERRGGR